MVKKIVLLILILFNCDYKKYLEAHKQNKLGIEKQLENKLEESIPPFSFSKSLQFKSYIPNYNLGNTYLAVKNYIEAHKKYEESLDEKPDFVEAIYNDGILLYLWGKDELDPKICNIEKVKNLWTESKNRFEDAFKKDSSKKYLKQSKENSEFLFLKLKELDEKGKSICEEQSEEDKEDDENNQNQENKLNLENSDSKNQAQNKNDKSKLKDKNKNQSENKKQNRSDKAGNNKDKSDSKDDEQDEKPKPTLSSEEEKKIDDEIKRIKNKEQNSKSFRRSRHQQSSKKYKTDELKKVLEETVW